MKISILFYKLDDFFLDIPQAKGSLQRPLAPLCCGHSSVPHCPHSSGTEWFLRCSFSPLKPSHSSQTDFNHVLLERLLHIGWVLQESVLLNATCPSNAELPVFCLKVCCPGSWGHVAMGWPPSQLAHVHPCTSKGEGSKAFIWRHLFPSRTKSLHASLDKRPEWLALSFCRKKQFSPKLPVTTAREGGKKKDQLQISYSRSLIIYLNA